MSTVSPVYLRPGDVAVLEVYLLRSLDEHSGATSGSFYMNAVNILAWAPRPGHEARESSEPSFRGYI